MIHKSIEFEMKDLNRGERTAVIAYSTYNTLDRDKDIARKGMASKSITESFKDIRFFLNHDKNQVPGKPVEFFEDDKHGYMKAYLGTHTLGEDVLKMMDEGIIVNASYGFNPVITSPIQNKGREFKEIKLLEVSALTHWGAHPASGITSVSKAWTPELADSLLKMENWCRNTTASDVTIKMILDEIELLKSAYDTESTPLATEPQSSDKDLREAIQLLTLKHF